MASKSIKNLDQEFQFWTTQVGDTVIYTTAPLPELEKMDQVRIFIEPGLIDKFKAMLDEMPGIDAAKILDISEKKCHRLRTGLGLADKYTGQSMTTQWRRRQEGK